MLATGKFCVQCIFVGYLCRLREFSPRKEIFPFIEQKIPYLTIVACETSLFTQRKQKKSKFCSWTYLPFGCIIYSQVFLLLLLPGMLLNPAAFARQSRIWSGAGIADATGPAAGVTMARIPPNLYTINVCLFVCLLTDSCQAVTTFSQVAGCKRTGSVFLLLGLAWLGIHSPRFDASFRLGTTIGWNMIIVPDLAGMTLMLFLGSWVPGAPAK